MKFSTLTGSFSYDGINEFLRDLSYGKGRTNPVKGTALNIPQQRQQLAQFMFIKLCYSMLTVKLCESFALNPVVAEPKLFIFGSGSDLGNNFGSGSSSSSSSSSSFRHILALKTVLKH